MTVPNDPSLTLGDSPQSEWAAPYPLLIISAVLLFIVAATASYDFIKLMRWVVLITFAWSSFIAWHAKRIKISAGMLAIALLFNPVVPVHLTRELWVGLDCAAGAIALVVAWLNRSSNPTESEIESFWGFVGFSLGFTGLVSGAFFGFWLYHWLGLGDAIGWLIAALSSCAFLFLAVAAVEWIRSRLRRTGA